MSSTPNKAPDTGALSSLTGGTPQEEGTDNRNPFALATATPGLYMTADHKYWVNGKGPFPSVTTALGVMDKPALTRWKVQQAATTAMHRLHDLIGMTLEEGRDLITGEAEKIRDSAAKVGTSVHLLAHLEGMPPGARESDPKPFEVSPDTFPYLEAFRGFLAFLEAQGGKIVSSEHAVWSQTDGYAGTYDLIISLNDELWLLDVKTSKGYYPDYGLQLAAYAHAEYIVLPNDPTLYPMPQIQHTAVLHLRPDAYEGPMQQGWRLVEYPTTDRDYVAFLAALELYNWKKEGRFLRSTLNRTTIYNDPKTQAT